MEEEDDDDDDYCGGGGGGGRDSTVGTATRHRLDGPEIESRQDGIFHTRPDRL